QGGPGGDAQSADEVNQEYAEKTTQMVLDYLNRQKDQPDPELLQELNWTKEQLQDFVTRWNRARDLASNGSDQDRQEWQEKLRDLGLRPPTLGPRTGSDRNDSFQQMQDSGSRVRYPSALRKQFEAFQRAMENRTDGN
ncbi:MAG: circumsporozoite protein- membrane associated protein, partial [bacterium]|nr:circumsporozoite protein- membrane associated protein [bacterium]